MGDDAEALARAVTRAGCVFVGRDAGTAFGDYVAGSNHVLPTGGAARFASALGAGTFRRRRLWYRCPPGGRTSRAARRQRSRERRASRSTPSRMERRA